MHSIGLPELLVLCAVFFVLAPVWVIPYWKIFSKAGYPAPLSLLMLVPLLGLVVLYVVAFSEWPALRRSQA